MKKITKIILMYTGTIILSIIMEKFFGIDRIEFLAMYATYMSIDNLFNKKENE